MKKLLSFTICAMTLIGSTSAQTTCRGPRKMWASINALSNTTTNGSDNLAANGKLLLTWRMLPTDSWDTSFYIFSQPTATPNGVLTRKSSEPIINSTCFQIATPPTARTTYYLISGDIEKPKSMITSADQKKAIMEKCLDSIVVDERIYQDKLPYISIPLKDTHEDVCRIDTVYFTANDVSVGDLDGDGEMEIVVKRLQSHGPRPGMLFSDGTGADTSMKAVRHQAIWDAYKLDGTLLWRVMSGPNSLLGNSTSFAVADFDGDGKCEMAIRTSEGTVFGDGTEIGDTNGDGKTDYRTWTGGWIDHYPSQGPEFVSVIDGSTGKELARADYIPRGTSDEWGDDYFKRANSHRMGVGCFDETGLPSILVGRGVYGKSVIRAYDYRDGRLTVKWTFDTSKSGKGKDGKANSTYAGQGNHSLNVADLDGDGFDEVMYGSMAVDHDGIGLWNTQLGHGDANHVGKFLPNREGLQVFHCLETGKTQIALHDAATGKVIWSKVADSNNDMGRCMVADIDDKYPGCEFWMYDSHAFSQSGTDLGYEPSSCNAGIWFSGSLNRQLINEGIIEGYSGNGRVFTMYRYSIGFINGTKSNPSWYGDLLGDWREEVIVPDHTLLEDIKIFSTWYPTNYKFPYLMSDHTYLMSALNENIGYNQPTNLGYFLGSGMDMSQIPLIDEQTPATLKGDVNEDKTVDISDIVAVINSIAGTQTYPLSDVNGDNATDISDVVAVINIIAGQ